MNNKMFAHKLQKVQMPIGRQHKITKSKPVAYILAFNAFQNTGRLALKHAYLYLSY
jgi:hypothetical protein